jgi:DNA repair exonuclease SbcCD ATPase subunit
MGDQKPHPTYPHEIREWPAEFRRFTHLWERIFDTDDDDAWLDQMRERREDWVRMNEELRAKVEQLTTEVAMPPPGDLAAPQRRLRLRRLLREIDDQIVELVKRDPRYLTTDFVVERILDARMIAVSYSKRIPLDHVDDQAGGEGESASPRQRRLAALSETEKEHRRNVENERDFLDALGDALKVSVGRGKASSFPRLEVRDRFRDALDAAHADAVEIRAARKTVKHNRAELERALRGKLRLAAQPARDALLDNPRAVREAALHETAAAFGAPEAIGAIRKLVLGIKAPQQK